jgi:anti-sigma B factor antagonist
LEIITDKQSEVNMVQIDGELDFFSADELRKLFQQYSKNNEKSVLLDLTGVPYIDSSGLGLLIEIQHTLQSAKGKLIITGLHSGIASIFRSTDLINFFDVMDTREQAIASFQ